MVSPLPGSIHGTSTIELLGALGRDWTASPQPAGAAPNLNSSRRGQRIEVLRSSIEPLLAGRAGAEVWLFGSLARGDWDARSDWDLLAVAPDQSAADQQAEALLGAGLADDVIGLSQGGFHAQDSYPCCQAAEKALKAVLLALDQEPERTDSIERLLGALELLGIETAPLRQLLLKPLQRMPTASRYPNGDEAPVDLFDARDGALALAVARAVPRQPPWPFRVNQVGR